MTTSAKIWLGLAAAEAVNVAAMVYFVVTMPTLLDDILSIATVLAVFLALWAYTAWDDEQQREQSHRTWGRND